jgi:outer membrane receptor protein involved in Fe transport
MKTVGLFAAIISITTATAGTADRALPPDVDAPAFTAPAPASVSQLPLLFIVDGVRYAGDQVPLLSAELVASVQIVRGHRALEQYGPDASYGVVVITTKLASVRRS